MLAQEYVFEYGDHVDGLILANTLANSISAHESMRSVLDELSEDEQATIEEYESQRAYDSPDYAAAFDGAYREHMCRTEEYPHPVLHTFENINMDVYGLMWGPNEYVLLETARLRDWDTRDRLDEIETETLVLSGHYDEISPDIAHDITQRVSNAEMVVFDESSHMPFWEQPDEHYEAVESFLST